MSKTGLILVFFALLGYAFFSSPPFQTIAAGVAIFLFGMLFLEEGFQADMAGVDYADMVERTKDRGGLTGLAVENLVL